MGKLRGRGDEGVSFLGQFSVNLGKFGENLRILGKSGVFLVEKMGACEILGKKSRNFGFFWEKNAFLVAATPSARRNGIFSRRRHPVGSSEGPRISSQARRGPRGFLKIRRGHDEGSKVRRKLVVVNAGFEK